MAEEELSFYEMSEAELRQWVEANPGRVDDRDRDGFTPSWAAVDSLRSIPLMTWLLDEKGADVNATYINGSTLLHSTYTLTSSRPCWPVVRTSPCSISTIPPLSCAKSLMVTL